MTPPDPTNILVPVVRETVSVIKTTNIPRYSNMSVPWKNKKLPGGLTPLMSRRYTVGRTACSVLFRQQTCTAVAPSLPGTPQTLVDPRRHFLMTASWSNLSSYLTWR
ncbi:hypothetical protein E2C01_090697 [Portunus trituberculatus]|uniref:Uncharacterized protein n=1 Tax=Portunus trituberculatus TaxID=210409 RepID=A0A5B7JM16_PORTR|nr:hypothetical protein [Portunus trituberculatus]